MNAQRPTLLITGLSLLLGCSTPAVGPAETPRLRKSNHPQNLEFVEFHQLKLISQQRPQGYPIEAKKGGIQGTVVVDMAIDETGTVYSALAISGPIELREVSEQNAFTFKFRPYAPAGVPIRIHSHLTNVWELR